MRVWDYKLRRFEIIPEAVAMRCRCETRYLISYTAGFKCAMTSLPLWIGDVAVDAVGTRYRVSGFKMLTNEQGMRIPADERTTLVVGPNLLALSESEIIEAGWSPSWKIRQPTGV